MSLFVWVVHLAAFVTLIGFAAMDPLFAEFASLEEAPWERLANGRAALAAAVSLVAVISLGVLIAGTVKGAKSSSRSVSRLLAITTMIALWFALFTNLDSVAWQGKRVRFASRLDRLESIANPLRRKWPRADGEIDSLGPFMAYPFGAPRTLLLLEAPRLASADLYVSAVERGDNGTIRLQLTGNDGGDWIEWHPDGSSPGSFIGGLGEHYVIECFDPIGRGWQLVRYRNPSPSLHSRRA